MMKYKLVIFDLDGTVLDTLGDLANAVNAALEMHAFPTHSIEQVRIITPEILYRYLPEGGHSAPMAAATMRSESDYTNERELLYKLLFDMRAEIGDLKRMVAELMHRAGAGTMEPSRDVKALLPSSSVQPNYEPAHNYEPATTVYAETEEVEEEPRERTKADVQREQIVRALRRNNGRRREAAAELFMSERTLYRKIKELGIEA